MSADIHDTIDPTPSPSREDNPANAEAIVREIQRPNQYEPETFEGPDGYELEGAKMEPHTPETMDRRHRDGHTLPSMDLPGFGEELDTCGDDWYVFCAHCGDPTRVGQTCRRSVCARCAADWCRRAAVSAASKLKALWAYKMASTSEHQFFHHVTISPPDDWALSGDPDTVFSRTKDVIKQIMDEFGLHGIPVYHPYRGSDEEPGDDMGEWSERVLQGLDWDDVRGDLKFSPHWHIIGVAPFFDITVTEEIEERTGWVIHRITKSEDSSVSIGNDWDLARVVSYCLSHAGIYETEQGHRAAYYPNVCDRYRPGSESITANESQEEEMDRIVRSVVPQTLGIDYFSVACGRDVPKGEGAATVSLSTAAGKAAGDGDGDGEQGDDQEGEEIGPNTLESPGPDETEKCQGRTVGIDKAPEYLNDSEWRREAPKAHTLRQTLEKFKSRRGIAG